MVKLKYLGDGETFFTINGIQYITVNREVEVPEEVAKKMLSNPNFILEEESFEEEEFKPKILKKNKMTGGMKDGYV